MENVYKVLILIITRSYYKYIILIQNTFNFISNNVGMFP